MAPKDKWQDPQWKADWERVQAQEAQDANAARDSFITAAEKAAKKHGHVETYRKIVQVFDKEFTPFSKEVKSARLDSNDRAELGASLNTAKRHASQRLKSDVARIKGGKEALMHIYQEQEGEGLFAPLVKSVYDSDHGGFQFGGILAAVFGGGAVFLATQGAGMLVNLLATVVAALAFSHVGNQFLDHTPGSEKPSKNVNFHTKSSPVLAKANQPKPTIARDTSHDRHPEMHPPSETGQLPSPTTPLAAALQTRQGLDSPSV